MTSFGILCRNLRPIAPCIKFSLLAQGNPEDVVAEFTLEDKTTAFGWFPEIPIKYAGCCRFDITINACGADGEETMMVSETLELTSMKLLGNMVQGGEVPFGDLPFNSIFVELKKKLLAPPSLYERMGGEKRFSKTDVEEESGRTPSVSAQDLSALVLQLHELKEGMRQVQTETEQIREALLQRLKAVNVPEAEENVAPAVEEGPVAPGAEETFRPVRQLTLEEMELSEKDRQQTLQKALSVFSEYSPKEGAMRQRIKASTDAHFGQSRKLQARRIKLISELRMLHPITRVIGSQAGRMEEVEFRIDGLPLPHPSEFVVSAEESISTALGYVVHYILLLSKYMDVPLRYKLTYSGSKSCIRNVVEQLGAESYPLHMRGQDRARFDVGVALLQQTLHQLSVGCGVRPRKGAHMLQTLQDVFETITGIR